MTNLIRQWRLWRASVALVKAQYHLRHEDAKELHYCIARAGALLSGLGDT